MPAAPLQPELQVLTLLAFASTKVQMLTLLVPPAPLQAEQQVQGGVSVAADGSVEESETAAERDARRLREIEAEELQMTTGAFSPRARARSLSLSLSLCLSLSLFVSLSLSLYMYIYGGCGR